MSANSVLTRDHWQDYLIHLYFGPVDDRLLRCINLAYLDFSRTLHGLSHVQSRDELHDKARQHLRRAFDALRAQSPPVDSQPAFDSWHRNVCRELRDVYAGHGYPRFYVGQAQKWINMTFKYAYTLGEERLPGFEGFYHLCHVPLDNIVMERLVKYGIPRPDCAWSRIDDYDLYLDYQAQVRRAFPIAPLDVEFFLWSGRETELARAIDLTSGP